VSGGQVLVAVAQMVLAEVAGGVAGGLEDLCEGGGFLLQAERVAGLADGRQAGADGVLAREEGCAAGGARGLGVVVAKRIPSIAMRSMLGVVYPMVPMPALTFCQPTSSP